MKISDLQPLDKVMVCRNALETPEALTCVFHAEAGEMDFLTDDGYSTAATARMCAAFLEVKFPQLRTLGDVPSGKVAILYDDGWQLEDIEYEEGGGPGEMPPVPPDDKRLEAWSYTCACCGEAKTGLPELSFLEPLSAFNPVDGAEVISLDEDLCAMQIEGQEYFFIRGLLPVAIPEVRDTYCFGVWSTISSENFRRYAATFQEEQRDLGTMFDFLNTALPGEAGTVGLQLNIVPGAPGKRPYLLLREPDAPHPVFEAQQTGISVQQLLEWVGPHLDCGGAA